jgi:hypothetical protein
MFTGSRWRGLLDPGLAVALLLATYAAWPLLTRPGLPTYNDAEQHVYRTVEMMSAWSAGVVYPRWAPDLYHGYGSPVFNYYAPLVYVLAAAYGQLGGPVAGVKAVLVLSACLGAVGMYVLGRRLWGGRAGIIAAAVYSLAPYIAYVDPLARGDAPEALALAIVPWMLWAFTRLLQTGDALTAALAALSLAGLIFAHNLVAILFFGWLLAWLAVCWLESRPSPRALWLCLAALCSGLALAACLWLPAVAERGAVRLADTTVGLLDFRRAFPPPEILFGWLNVLESRWSMGVLQWLLAALGVLSLLWARSGRVRLAFVAASAVGALALMLPAALPVWEAFPPLAFLQFPWRLLGPASLFAGLLAGALAAQSARWRWRPAGALFPAVVVAACVAGLFPGLDPLPWADFETASVSRLLKSALDWDAGTTASNEFLPATVKTPPPYRPELLQSYQTSLVDKVDRSQLPPAAQATVLAHTPVEDRFQIVNSAPFTLTVLTFDFPGWAAQVDGVSTPVVPSVPEGWITLAVPGGPHDVRVWFGDTFPRQLGGVLSLAAALGILGLAGWGLWRRKAAASAILAPQPVSGRLALVLGGLVAAGLVVRAAADPFSPWRVKPAQVTPPPAQVQTFKPFQSQLALIGYDLPQTTAGPGDAVPLALYWEAVAPATRNLRSFVHLLAADGTLRGVSDNFHPGGLSNLATSRWPVFRYVRDDHAVQVDPATPPGVYILHAGLWDGLTGERMQVLDLSGQPTGQDGVVLTDHFVVTAAP